MTADPTPRVTEPSRPTTRQTRRRRRITVGVAAAGAAAALVGTALVAPAWADVAPADGTSGGASVRPADAAATPTVPRSKGTDDRGSGRRGADIRGSARHRSDVQANLWEWNWPSVGRECTTVLGPAGYGGVQVAPPANSLSRTAPDAETGGRGGVRHPWWEVYQPATYELDSRMGTEEQFQAMVDTCRAAGVKVYVDAVVNHMTGQGETSYTGADYDDYTYPTEAGAEPGSLYDREDFHARGDGVDQCPTGSGDIEDFNDERQVLRCELLSLEDLRTDVPATREKVVAYLDDLIARGVSGFRVDAAKHVGNEDLAAMLDELDDTVDGERPQWALEVFPGSPGTLSQRAATGVGDVLGFDYAYQLKNAFTSYPDGASGNITSLRVFGEDAGLVPSESSLVFVQNHDTERGDETLSYRDGATNVIANQLMLAHPYGTPQVYSAFTFEEAYASPPADDDGFITDTDCDSDAWACVDRDPQITAMVAFHAAVGDAPLDNWYDDGINLIAFSRGDRGFFAVNNAEEPVTAEVSTGLRAGTYCDTLGAARTPGGGCEGDEVRVGADGNAEITVEGKSALALTAGTPRPVRPLTTAPRPSGE